MSSRRSFRATTEAFSLWQPGIVPKDLQAYGVPVGYEQVTGRIVWLWLHSLNPEANYIRIEGMKGSGKTTFMKSMMIRMSCYQARDVRMEREFLRSRVSSRKPNAGLAEYVPVLNFLETDIHSLGKGAGFNVFGLFRTQAEVSVVAVFLANHLAQGRMNPTIRVAILAGVHKMFASNTSPHPKRLEKILRTLNYEDFLAFYLEDNVLVEKVLEKEELAFPATTGEMALTRKDVRETRPEEIGTTLFEERHLKAANDAADIFLEFVRGFKGIFMGEDSMRDILTGDIVGIDEYDMADGAAEIWEAIVNKAEANALSYGSSDEELLLTKLLPHINWSDEEGEAMNSTFHARFKAQKVNKLRALPTALVEAQQYHIQGDQSGQEGSEHRKYSMEIEFGVGGYIIFRQPDSPSYLDKYRERGMPEEYVKLLPKQQTGQATLFVPGKAPVRFNHALLPSEIPLIQTTQASIQMNTHTPITETDEWARRVGSRSQGEFMTAH